MFLAKECRDSSTFLIFTVKDPREDGYAGEVIENVSFSQEPGLHDWRLGHNRPGPTAIGRQDENYREFPGRPSLLAAGYEPIEGQAFVEHSWLTYRSR